MTLEDCVCGEASGSLVDKWGLELLKSLDGEIFSEEEDGTRSPNLAVATTTRKIKPKDNSMTTILACILLKSTKQWQVTLYFQVLLYFTFVNNFNFLSNFFAQTIFCSERMFISRNPFWSEVVTKLLLECLDLNMTLIYCLFHSKESGWLHGNLECQGIQDHTHFQTRISRHTREQR